jgi:hypothetical protein
MRTAAIAILCALLAAAPVVVRASDVECWGDALYASGGVGVEEREDLLLKVPDANLRVTTAEQGSGAFLAGVQLEIVDDCGVTRLETILDGPIFLAKLKPGRYQLRLTHGGRLQTRLVSVPARGQRSEFFYWRAAPASGGG